MLYKVFLVEDEIVAREGIRDNVDWHAAGFEFCGEASDGEVALPLVEAARPDVLITDIKMPFMDGLQLSKIVRERFPEVKIVILSGHDEFQYAQDAIKLGVSEYLLKPVSVRDLHALLERMAAQLASERKQRENLLNLQSQVDHNLPLLRERFLLRLVTGGVTPLEAIEQSRELGIDIVAPAYQIVVAKVIPLLASTETLDYGTSIEAWQMAYNAVDGDADTFTVQKDLDELILLLKGHDAAEVSSRGHQLAARIRTAAAAMGNCCLRVATGTPQQRLSDVQHSLTTALLQLQNEAQRDRQDAIVDEGAGYAKVLAFRDVQGGKRAPAVIERARDFIEQHFHDPGLSLQEVAEYVHLSANHFSSIFSSAAGETFKEYVTRLRIERAKELLRGTEHSAADICYAVGYSDPHYFSAAFKKATGMSPRQYRSPTDVDDDERMV